MTAIFVSKQEPNILFQVKELGVFASDCPALAADLQKIYDIYWYAGNNNEVLKPWPQQFSTAYNIQNPMNVLLNNIPARVFLAVIQCCLVTLLLFS